MTAKTSSDTVDSPITAEDPGAAVREFFERLGRYCAAVDFASLRPLVADDVASFGTKATIVTGLDRLQQQQWEGIWPNIADFVVDVDNIVAEGDSEVAWGMTVWASTGFDEAGQPFDRPGRATVVLRRRKGRWLAVHTHFSVVPGTPPRTYGRGGK